MISTIPNAIAEKPTSFGRAKVAIQGLKNNIIEKTKETKSKSKINHLRNPFVLLKRATKNKFPILSNMNQTENIIPKNIVLWIRVVKKEEIIYRKFNK